MASWPRIAYPIITGWLLGCSCARDQWKITVLVIANRPVLTCDLCTMTCVLRPVTCVLWPAYCDLWPVFSSRRNFLVLARFTVSALNRLSAPDSRCGARLLLHLVVSCKAPQSSVSGSSACISLMQTSLYRRLRRTLFLLHSWVCHRECVLECGHPPSAANVANVVWAE